MFLSFHDDSSTLKPAIYGKILDNTKTEGLHSHATRFTAHEVLDFKRVTDIYGKHEPVTFTQKMSPKGDLVHLGNLRAINLLELSRLLPHWSLLSHLSRELAHLRLFYSRTKQFDTSASKSGKPVTTVEAEPPNNATSTS